MWIAQNSATVEPVLIEIESPDKRWWKKSGDPTADLNHALSQIAEWKQWFASPENELQFRNFYDIRLEGRALRPKFALIYGRRTEANATTPLIGKRNHVASESIETMTFDRLTPDPKASEEFCVRMTVSREVTALHVPPTMTLSPMYAPTRLQIRDKESAIAANTLIGDERKQFLISRLGYWDNWAASGNGVQRGVVGVSDRE